MKNLEISMVSDGEILPCSEYDSELNICKITKKSCDGCYINPIKQGD